MDVRAGIDEGWLVLNSPLKRFHKDGAEVEVGHWQRVAIPYKNISEIWLKFSSASLNAGESNNTPE
jgi:hypothetical protein